MIPFKRLLPEDRERIYDCFNRAGREGCEYSFVNLYLWGKQLAARVGDYFTVFSHFYGHSMYLFPAGQGDLRPVLEALRQDAGERGIPFRMTAMTQQDCDDVEAAFPGVFQFTPDRDGCDYLYEVEHLAELKGKKYQQKRNHINRFLEAAPQWHAEEITPGLLPVCRQLLDRWYRTRLEEDPHSNFHLEQLATDRALRCYEALALEGLVLFNGEEPVAMTMGSRLSDTVFDVHFEKALGLYPGDYAMINQCFARYIRDKYPEIRYLNREDDMGLPGLRKAKLSYHPDRMVEQFRCFVKEDLYES